MEEKQIKKLIQEGRKFMQYETNHEFDFVSDQENKLKQPPLVKESLQIKRFKLPHNFNECNIKHSFMDIINERKSSRVFTNQTMTLLQLSYLLWATQGIKEIRGKSYATLRTVPSGGARHGFETYLLIQNCEGLETGLYHYLPMEHELEYIREIDELQDSISKSLCGQDWAKKANVVFYWSFVAYRCEWRYGIYAHRVALIDAGHVGQNLYLACTALGLGTCGIAAFDDEYCSKMIGLDNDEEFIVYTAPVGTIDPTDLESEKSFYRFVEVEGL